MGKRKDYGTTIDEDLLFRFKVQALKEGRKQNDILEELLEEYLKKKEAK